jgi:hypothetical protein
MKKSKVAVVSFDEIEPAMGDFLDEMNEFSSDVFPKN